MVSLVRLRSRYLKSDKPKLCNPLYIPPIQHFSTVSLIYLIISQDICKNYRFFKEFFISYRIRKCNNCRLAKEKIISFRRRIFFGYHQKWICTYNIYLNKLYTREDVQCCTNVFGQVFLPAERVEYDGGGVKAEHPPLPPPRLPPLEPQNSTCLKLNE